jgi:hypothetical protein
MTLIYCDRPEPDLYIIYCEVCLGYLRFLTSDQVAAALAANMTFRCTRCTEKEGRSSLASRDHACLLGHISKNREGGEGS